MLCDAQIKNDRRLIILSSIVKIHNNTTMPLVILSIDSIDKNKHNRIHRIDINDEYNIPLDLLYEFSSSPIFISIDE